MKRRKPAEKQQGMSRRSFLQAAGAGAIAGGLGMPLMAGAFPRGRQDEQVLEWRNKKDTMKYRRLGRTNMMVSEIGYGCSTINRDNVDLVLHAMDKGLNFLDTARAYGRGASESAIGKAICADRREDIFIVTKGPSRAKSLVRSVDRSLDALRTDVIDVMMVHGVRSTRVVNDEETLDALADLKKSGKIRFTGLSSHTNVVETCLEAVKSGKYDVVLGAFSVLNEEGLKDVCKHAKENDVGVVVMKSANAGAWKRRHVERGRYREKDLHDTIRGRFNLGEMNVYQACYRWALDHPEVASVIPLMDSQRTVNEDLKIPFLKFE